MPRIAAPEWSIDLKHTLDAATEAALTAGRTMRRHLRSPKKVHQATQHDIKLELDIRCQRQIERLLLRAFPSLPILGEEGVRGNPMSSWRWIVDPIDGTVNFAHGIPHCCTTIALQQRQPPPPAGPTASGPSRASYSTVQGVVYDPFCDELWIAQQGRLPRLNGRVIQVSQRRRLNEAVVGIGFAKEKGTLKRMLPVWQNLIHRVRKIRIMGAAALGLAYVATGRLDAYLEYGLRIWDVAAGGLLVATAGGTYWTEDLTQPYQVHVIGSNARLSRPLGRYRQLGAERSGA